MYVLADSFFNGENLNLVLQFRQLPCNIYLRGIISIFIIFDFAETYTFLQPRLHGRGNACRIGVVRLGHSTKRLDLTGQRFGRLTVLCPAENIGKRTAWACRCDCGREITVKTCHLRNGHVTSCGCIKRGITSLTYIDGTCVELLRAKTVRRNNTSGVPGVDWLPFQRRWRASICFKGKRYYLGKFSVFEDAVNARKAAEARLHDAFVAEYSSRAEEEESTAFPRSAGA